MFSNELAKISWEDSTRAIYSKTSADVERALGKEHLDVNDFMRWTYLRNYWHTLLISSQK